MATRSYEENLALIQSRIEGADQSKSKVNPVTEATQLCLDFWPCTVRGVPNPVLRGALFGVSQVRVVYQKRTLIATTSNYQIRFKGETWNQTDLDVLCGMLHLAMPHPLGTKVEFSVNAFLKSLGRAPSGEQHEQFKEQISRLMGGVIEVLSVKDKKSFLGTLIKNAYRDEVSKRYVIIFNEKTLQLFQVGYSLIDWEYRQALGKNNLAKWLHAFYSTHAGAYEYKVETLNTLCGSTTKRLGDFRKSLINALQKLKDIGAIQSWSIGEFSDLVNVVTYPTNTQKKYIYKSKRAVKSQSKAGLI